MSYVPGSCFFFFSSRRRHTRCLSDWSSDVCSSDLVHLGGAHDLEGPRPVGDVEDVVVVFEDQPERFPDTRIVVNDQDHRPRHRGWTLPLGPGACRRTAHPVELPPSFAADPGAAGCCATISRKVVSVTAPLRN